MTILTKKNYFIELNDDSVTISRLAKGKMWAKNYKITTVGELGRKLQIIEAMNEEEWAWFCGFKCETLENC